MTTYPQCAPKRCLRSRIEVRQTLLSVDQRSPIPQLFPPHPAHVRSSGFAPRLRSSPSGIRTHIQPSALPSGILHRESSIQHRAPRPPFALHLDNSPPPPTIPGSRHRERRGSKVVMHWSAKPVCAGSIPALASTKNRLEASETRGFSGLEGSAGTSDKLRHFAMICARKRIQSGYSNMLI